MILKSSIVIFIARRRSSDLLPDSSRRLASADLRHAPPQQSASHSAFRGPSLLAPPSKTVTLHGQVNNVIHINTRSATMPPYITAPYHLLDTNFRMQSLPSSRSVLSICHAWCAAPAATAAWNAPPAPAAPPAASRQAAWRAANAARAGLVRGPRVRAVEPIPTWREDG